MLFHPGSGGVADLHPPQRQGHLTQPAVCKGTPTSAPGNMAPLLGREGYSWLWGAPLSFLQESVELGEGAALHPMPIQGLAGQGLILALETPGGQGAR